MSSISAFESSLGDQTVKAVCEGAKRVAIWGFNGPAMTLMALLNRKGISFAIVAIVDPRANLHGVQCGHLVVSSPDCLADLNIDCLVVALNAEKEDVLIRLAQLLSTRPRVVIAGIDHMSFHDAAFTELHNSLLVSSRAAGYPLMAAHLYQAFYAIAKQGLQGDVAEFGVYKGGTTVLLAKTMRHFGLTGRIHAFDTFDGFPPARSLLDLYGDQHDAFSDFGAVRDYCNQFDVELIRGNICDTYGQLADKTLVLSFFDTDNYSATRQALELCYQRTVRGGVLAFDHYYCDERWLYTIGERIAANEVLSGKPLFHLHGTGIFVKLA